MLSECLSVSIGFYEQYLSIKNELCIARPILNDLNSNELHYCQSMASLDRCNWVYLLLSK